MLEFTFAYCASHQLITDMANSATETIRLCPSRRCSELHLHHAQRIHELMRHRPHNDEY